MLLFSKCIPMLGVNMEGARLWSAAFLLYSVLTSGLAVHQRRSMAAPTLLPVSKGGWRPVVGSGGLPGFGPFQVAPLHAPNAYRIPVPVLDALPSSSRPIAARDASKQTPSVPQQYHHTTLRSFAQAPSPSPNQPINTYLNPFALPTGLSHYKIVQNFPMESVVLRNPHNPYNARPGFSKYPMKYKQSLHNGAMQHLNNVQPVQFGYSNYVANKPHDIFSKPVEVYLRPSDAKKPQAFKQDPNAPEIYKPEVYKLPDSDTASQSVNQQQVKTAQQQQNLSGNLKPPSNSYPQQQFRDQIPPSILGTFNTFGVQSVKGRDPVFPATKTTYMPPAPTKQTIFNSFSYTPTYKTTPNQFVSTTPKLQSNYNHLVFGAGNDFKIPPTQQVKLSTPFKTEYATSNKGMFKASPQDPFVKHSQHRPINNHQNLNKHHQITTYSPSVPTTQLNKYYNSDLRAPPQVPQQQQQPPFTSYYNQNFDKKNKIQDSFASSVNQYPASQYPSPPKKHELEATPNSVPFRATYDVTEIYGDDVVTQTSQHSWSPAPDDYVFGYQQKTTTEQPAVTSFNKPTTLTSNLPEEYEIVTEGYENSLHYDSNVENQNKRPSSGEFEPIGKHKLKDYYYKVSTPSHEELTTTNYKRTKTRPTVIETTIRSTEAGGEYSTNYNINKYNSNSNENETIEALPTLPPNQHFKRPSSSELLDKDKIRKRIKNRRRRPPHSNRLQEKDETSTRKYIQPSTDSYTTETYEVHTYRPRPRLPNFSKPKSTTPAITTDLTTSALPTISPTTPTTIKKRVRRPSTTPAERFETTTFSYKDSDINKESQIMKIATRDYSHKQDEKDTPTSDVSVSISETTTRNRLEPLKFSFHKDVKPIEATPEDLHVKELEKPTSTAHTEVKKISDNERKTITTTETLVPIPTSEASLSNTTNKGQRPRLKTKYDSNRPRFSVKDYRNRMSSTTTTEKSSEPHVHKLRFPQRRLPFQESKFNTENDNTTEVPRKKFIPKDPRHKQSNVDETVDSTTEKEIHSTRTPQRQRTTLAPEPEITQKMRIRNGSRRPKPTEETTETSSQASIHTKRPTRKKVKDTDHGESVQDISVTETTVHYDQREDMTTEKKSESAIMKIAKEDKKHQSEQPDSQFEHSKRVSDLTLAASKDYNTPGLFKAVSPNSRRIPSYFTIATDDPILPIEAFFPQLNQKKES